MLATILKSPMATQVTVAIMRAFVVVRRFSLTYGQIVEKLAHLNGKFAKTRALPKAFTEKRHPSN